MPPLKRCVIAVMAIAAASLAGCKDLPDVDPPDVEVPSLPLPKSADGAYQLIEVAGSRLDINPAQRDPITAVGRCADLVTACHDTGESLDACIQAAPVCLTAEPWKEENDCCPAACAKGFASARAKGEEPLPAMEKVFFALPTCFPGVAQLVGDSP